jgi:hypothetical protein
VTHTVHGNLRVDQGGTYRGIATGAIDDEETFSYSAPATIGALLISARNDPYSTVYGLFHFDCGGFMAQMTVNALMQTSTSATSSAGITDGKVGVSCPTGTTVYIINRFGATIDLSIIPFGQ